jgi:hypothetical protein
MGSEKQGRCDQQSRRSHTHPLLPNPPLTQLDHPGPVWRFIVRRCSKPIRGSITIRSSPLSERDVGGIHRLRSMDPLASRSVYLPSWQTVLWAVDPWWLCSKVRLASPWKSDAQALLTSCVTSGTLRTDSSHGRSPIRSFSPSHGHPALIPPSSLSTGRVFSSLVMHMDLHWRSWCWSKDTLSRRFLRIAN